MGSKEWPLPPRKKIALVAHDNKKSDLFEWVLFNKKLLGQHELYAAGTTGTLLARTLRGDQQIGAKIIEGDREGAGWAQIWLRQQPGGTETGEHGICSA